jgi:hypothetical protein
MKGKLPAESVLSKIVVTANRVVIGLNLKNEQAAIFSLDQKHDTVTEFQVTYPDQNFIEDLVYDEDNDKVIGIISNFLSRKQNKIYLVALAEDLNFSYDMELSPVLGGKVLNTAKVHISDSAGYLLAGTYGNMAAKLSSPSEYFGIESAGVFTTRIRDQKQEFINYYNFVEFRNLRAGVSAKDFYRLQKRRDRETGEYSLNYELLLHDLLLHDSSLVMMMEVFYPEFRTVSDISYDYWGRPVTHSYTVFEGFRFYNSILAGFNLEGELEWDNSLEIDLPPSGQLDKKVAYYFDDEPAILFYNDGSRISYRIFLGNAELESFNDLELETSEPGDKITVMGQNYIAHWYENFFLAYGYHTIRNNLLLDRNERTVFYINKISLE